ncbi:MAG: toll/interleukin-1 receptor domain-containing protein [candidate division KSB1 bacterium]
MDSSKHIFISYSRADGEFALELARDLRKAGIDIWMDRLDIAPGARWDREVEAALNTCERLLIILSPSSAQSENVQDEIGFAMREKRPIIPVLYRPCKVPLRLHRLQHIDFTKDYAQGLEVLIDVLTGKWNPEASLFDEAPTETPKPASRPVEPIAERIEKRTALPAQQKSSGMRGFVYAGLALVLLAGLYFFVDQDPLHLFSEAKQNPPEKISGTTPAPEKSGETAFGGHPKTSTQPGSSQPDSLRREEARREAQSHYEALIKQAEDAAQNHQSLLAGYRGLMQKYPDFDGKSAAQKTIWSLEQDSARFAGHLALAQSDTITILDQRGMWQAFAPSRNLRYEAVYAEKRKSALESLITKYPHIASENKFVTCRNVNREKNQPEGKTEKFSASTVYVWAQISAASADRVTFRWYADGVKLGEDQTAKIDRNENPGYRTSRSMKYGPENEGRNEVRLYNSNNDLIGRRVFYVGRP